MENDDISLKLNGRVSSWKQRLLDLSRRNALISFKDSGKSTLIITSPEPEELFNKLVKEKQLSFCCPIEDVSDFRTYAVLRLMEELGKQVTLIVGDIKTKNDFTTQQKVLYNLRSKAKLAKEEQGTNILYLSFGFIEWKQPDKNDEVLKSPLLMMPVVLSHESANSPYVLSIGDDEIEVNPALDYLMNTYGTDLPTFELTDDNSLSNYFKIIDDIITPRGWRLIKQVSIGLFSFLKISMYHDLENNREKIINTPILRAMSGDLNSVNKLNELVEKYKDFDLDCDYDVNGEKMWHLAVDADSSQQKAILYAKKGLSFVLQGPPGTGKSQTIANIIAESLADGKKVLFVSEKAAALQVVYRRLQECGLGDFCLPLHSHKAGKKEVINDIGKNLSLQQTKLNENADLIFSLLKQDKSFLNEYAKEIHEKIQPCSLSLYEIIGKISSLSEVKKLDFSIPNVSCISDEALNNIIIKIKALEKALKKLDGKPLDSAWYGFTGEEKLTGELFKDKFLTRTKELDFHILALNQYVEANKEVFGEQKDLTFKKAKELEIIIKIAALPETFFFNQDYNSIKNIIDNINRIYKPFNLINSYLKLNLECNLENIEDAVSASSSFLAVKHLCSKWFTKDGCKEAYALLDNALKHKNIYDEKTNLLFKDWLPEALELDAKELLYRFKTEYSGLLGGIFKIFNGRYYRDIDKIKSVSRYGRTLHTSEIIDFLQLVTECQNELSWFEENKENMILLFGLEYCKPNSDFSEVRRCLLAFEQFESIYKDNIIPSDIKDILLKNEKEKFSKELEEALSCLNLKNIENVTEILNKLDTMGDIHKALEHCSIVSDEIASHLDKLRFEIKRGYNNEEKLNLCKVRLKELILNVSEKLNIFCSYFYNINEDNTPLHLIRMRYVNCCSSFMKHELYLDYAQSSYECIKIGLKDFVDSVAQINEKECDLVPLFEKGYYKQLFISLLEKNPKVSGFRRSVFDEVFERFVKNDEKLLSVSRADIYSRTVGRFPQKEGFAVAGGEVEILRHEIGKTRNLMPLRKLFKKIPNLLMTLKPCFMMSPLTVSYFLDADLYSFDIVVFDEASQVFPEDAIGAILRAKQVIIAGDSKQLPPTNFFKASNNDSDEWDTYFEDEEDEISESILEEAAIKLPATTLLWHYRSRHEDLIAFSNKSLYGDNLVTFPANNEFEKDTGVDFVYDENGVYEGKGINTSEAKLCAKLVEEHINTHPDRSLGVIAFSKRQETAIENEIQKLRKRHEEYEWFFNEQKDDEFFVKNLENVQGDERDTIILSVGYGKTTEQKAENKQMYMRFGPLGQLGGERRLNVAITRAKHNLKIISSIKFADMGETNSEGVKLLKEYLKYAETSDYYFTAAESQVSNDSLVDDIGKYIVEQGFKIHKNFGCSGKGIDIAVEHPDFTGKFMAAIEVDGTNYKSSKTAKDRERLRKSVLAGMGWNVYRIWSTGWIMNPELEKHNLLEFLKNCITINNSVTENKSETEQFEEKEEYFDTLPQQLIEDNPEAKYNPYGFSYLGIVSENERVVKIPMEGAKQRSIETIPEWELDLVVEAVMTNVYGILQDDLMRAVCKALKYSRTTDKMKKYVSKSIERLLNNGKLTITSEGKVKRADV